MKFIISAQVLLILINFSFAQDSSLDDKMQNDNKSVTTTNDTSFFSSETPESESVRQSFYSIDLAYGIAVDHSIKQFNKFSSMGLTQIGIWDYDIKNHQIFTDLIELKAMGLSIGAIKPDFYNKSETKDYDMNLYRFSVGYKTSYGFNILQNTIFFPYSSTNFSVNKINIAKKNLSGSIATTTPEDDLAKKTRYGWGYEAGFNFFINKSFSVNIGAERNFIMPRYMVWKDMGGFLIENIVTTKVEDIANFIAPFYPKTGCIMMFALPNLVRFGFTQLRKEKMCWPFDSRSPYMYDVYNISVSVKI